ncbi:MAG: copper chaperone [Phylliscum demangeonii]|nr:MAG: copper chaperone [Phylliscum demangeonii]
MTASFTQLDGVRKISADLRQQLVSIEGTAAPSAILQAIQSTGRDAILRGTGQPNSAAVCILESHAPEVANRVRGLARMVQVSSGVTLVDLTVRGLSPGKYWATIRESGDISRGAVSTGGIWGGLMSKLKGNGSGKETGLGRGVLGTIDINGHGTGSVLLDRPIAIWEVIGRSLVVSGERATAFTKNDANVLVGVIARSAGMWENDKTVCSCSGKTLWEERREQVARGLF